MPVMLKMAITIILINVAQRAGAESYQGEITRRNKGLGSRRMHPSPGKEWHKLSRSHAQNQVGNPAVSTHLLVIVFSCTVAALISGCAMKQPMKAKEVTRIHKPGTILDTGSGQPVSFDELIGRLAGKRVTYVGERHDDTGHHEIQLRIIRTLESRLQKLAVGMEMFDYTYQDKLDRWSAGQYDWNNFLKQTHWYANWKFDDSLYQDILMHIQARKIRLIGLNIPFHLPPKIAIGGLDSLSRTERAMLPERIDTTNSAHRDYIKDIFQFHHHFNSRGNFENFYEAQCAWEDGMARAIARHLGTGHMVVLVGNGHIVKKFGIPDRAYDRTQASFYTVYLASPDEKISSQTADFIWFTSKSSCKTKP
jgi:uncharacterized iron-regulated protein